MGVTTVSPTDAVDRAFDRIAADGRDGIWITLVDRDAAIDAAGQVERRLAAGEHLPLAGMTLAVKNNIDVAGRADHRGAAPPSPTSRRTSAPVVAALVDAGAVVVGVTNMDQFATGLVGTRSPYGICPNAHRPEPRVGRIELGVRGGGRSGPRRPRPRHRHRRVGSRPGRRQRDRRPQADEGLAQHRGVVPACASLDCVSVFASDVDAAATATAIAGGRVPDSDDPWSRPRPVSRARSDRPWRIGIPDIDSLTFDGDVSARAAFVLAIAAIRELDVDIVPVDVSFLVDCGRMLYGSAFVAERYAAVGRFVDDHPDEVDPIVGPMISASSRFTATDLFGDLERLEGFRRRSETMWGTDGGVDMVAVPTAPRIPTVAEVLAEPIAVNSMLGTYTNFVNLLDQCALAVPVAIDGSSSAMFPHVTFVARAWDDAALVDVARRVASA